MVATIFSEYLEVTFYEAFSKNDVLEALPPGQIGINSYNVALSCCNVEYCILAKVYSPRVRCLVFTPI